MVGTGVFLCTCSGDVDLDFKALEKKLKKEEVVIFEVAELLCQDKGLPHLTQHLRWTDERKPERVIIGACSKKHAFFEKVLEAHNLPKDALEVVNIREHCAWVHEDKRARTEKARIYIEKQISGKKYSPRILELNPRKEILIVGGLHALRLSQEMKNLGASAAVANNTYLRKECDLCIQAQFCAPERRECLYQTEIPFYQASIKNIKGTLGDLEVEFEKKNYIDMEACVECGKCVGICKQQAIHHPADSINSVYVIDERCNECKDCVKICPTNAIRIETKNEKIKTGQIISFTPLTPREGIFVVADGDALESYKLAQAAGMRALVYAQGVQKEVYIDANTNLCANNRIYGREIAAKGCTLCKDACSYGAVDSGRIDHNICRECGACIGVCPQGVICWAEHPQAELLRDIEWVLKTDITPKIIVFACSECGYETLHAAGEMKIKYPVVLPLTVPCLGSIAETHLLRAFDLGAEGVVLAGCKGGKCANKTGFKNAGKRTAFLKAALKVFGIEESRIMIFNSNPEKPEELAKSLSDFTREVRGASKLKKLQPLQFDEIEEDKRGRREALISIFKGFSEKLGVTAGIIGGDYPFGDAEIDTKKCTLCAACASVCSTGSITTAPSETNQEGWVPRIFFTHSYCTACRICEETCPEKAITVKNLIDIKRFIEKTKSELEIKLVECEECGTPIMAYTAYNKLSDQLGKAQLPFAKLCRDCRDKVVIAATMGLDPKEIRIYEQGKRRI